ncbi:prolyl-tRNA synthetase associated domain-containing protein 1 [Phacochoerus africanus]|uniref:prolyl-tRNA synthetase associated domain-containing protein 1 n=1 Tax=Phacochoerus africanus TaxID=41426 RepID=UPI001FD90D55|nr:prolyl-tRNA synthetase associated domain-containing protein 1 [Phacochoerus africanus]
MQAPPSAGTRGKEPFRFGKALLADLDDFQEKAKATEKSENAATPPREGACSRLAAPTRVLPGTSARPAARWVGQGHAQFLFRVSSYCHEGSMSGTELRAALEQRLSALAIRTEIVEHPEVFTVEEMMPHIQHLKGAHSKNLFLKDKKKKGYWLVTVLHDRQINLNDLAKQLGVGSGNLRFADETAMLEKLKVVQGCVTPLALFCDDGDVKFVLDSAFLEGGHEKVYFHPMTNTATMGLSPEDFLTFVKNTGHDPIILNFDKN